MPALDESTADDDAFLAAFEATTLEPFRHRDHLRAAWLYLRRHAFVHAAVKFVGNLRRFVEAKGAAAKYHETITWAYLTLVHERMHASRRDCFEDFLADNPDLADHKNGLISRLYDDRVLKSDLAREIFLLPR